MADHIKADETLNPHARGHQEDRIHFGAIGLFAAGLIAVVVVIFYLLVLMINLFREERQQLEDQRPALFALDDPDLFPGARLQAAPGRDMAAMRSQVEDRLNSYGWVDQDRKFAHIPIDRAIELVAERGLPVRPAPEEGAPE